MPTKLSAKNKLAAAAVIWLLITGAMFGYLFNLLQTANRTTVFAQSAKNKELEALKAERESFLAASRELKELSRQKYQPEDFFSKDITLVEELKVLEKLAEQSNVSLVLSGISGTVKTAPKAKTATNLATVPYSISLKGPFGNVVRYINALEHLGFVTSVQTINISSLSGDSVNATLTASFYLRKQ